MFIHCMSVFLYSVFVFSHWVCICVCNKYFLVGVSVFFFSIRFSLVLFLCGLLLFDYIFHHALFFPNSLLLKNIIKRYIDELLCGVEVTPNYFNSFFLVHGFRNVLIEVMPKCLKIYMICLML